MILLQICYHQIAHQKSTLDGSSRYPIRRLKVRAVMWWDVHNNSLPVYLEYLNQVRTKRRSLDRAELSSSPTKEVGEESQGMKIHCYHITHLSVVCFVEDKPQQNQQPIESLMKTYALNTSDLHASPNTNNSPSLKPRNMPIRAIIPPGKSNTVNSNSQHHEKEVTPPDDNDDDALQKRATPPLEYAQKGPSQSPSPDYYEQQEQYNRTGAIQVTNLRKSPVFPRRIIQPAQVIPSPQQQQQQQQQHRQQLPQPSKSLSPKASPIMSRRAVHEPSGSIRPPQGGGSMISRLSPGRTIGGGGGGGGIKTPTTAMNKSSHTPPGSLQHQQQQQQQQHLQGNIARPMGKLLTKQPSPLQQRKQLMGPSHSPKGALNHHQQRPPTHRLHKYLLYCVSINFLFIGLLFHQEKQPLIISKRIVKMTAVGWKVVFRYHLFLIYHHSFLWICLELC